MSILNSLNKDYTLKQLNIKQLNELCLEIRELIIEAVSKNGGHLSSNLGAVELTVALHYVFDAKTDKFIFDVGHQAYTHKILTDRLEKINTIRKGDGISGFPDPNESPFDAFSVGHAGTSISAGLGYAFARDSKKEDYYVINVVGDASFLNGENLEAISANENKPKKFLTILNDNGMSISKNNNGLYKFISKVTTTKRYNKFNDFLSRTIGKCFIGTFLRGIKKLIKRIFNKNNFIENLGYKYVGIFDGHDLKSLIRLLTQIKESENPTLLHVKTVKGKGLTIAEENSTKYHGVSKNMQSSTNAYSNVVSDAMEELLTINPNLAVITAGMRDGVGLTKFSENHPDKFVDVGIAEEFAVTYAGGMAKGGIKPFVFIYSTFLQRSYDQIVHDVCLQNLPVVFCLDRAGLVGSDGKTHQGVFDLSYLKHIPNLTILAPSTTSEFKSMLKLSLDINSPVAIRYPNGDDADVEINNEIDKNLSWDVLKTGGNTVLYCVGGRMLDIANKVANLVDNSVTIVNARTVKPLDSKTLLKFIDYNVITLEDNVKIGGFGESVLAFLYKNSFSKKFYSFGVKDKFIEHDTVSNQMIFNEITPQNVIEVLKIF